MDAVTEVVDEGEVSEDRCSSRLGLEDLIGA